MELKKGSGETYTCQCNKVYEGKKHNSKSINSDRSKINFGEPVYIDEAYV